MKTTTRARKTKSPSSSSFSCSNVRYVAVMFLISSVSSMSGMTGDISAGKRSHSSNSNNSKGNGVFLRGQLHGHEDEDEDHGPVTTPIELESSAHQQQQQQQQPQEVYRKRTTESSLSSSYKELLATMTQDDVVWRRHSQKTRHRNVQGQPDNQPNTTVEYTYDDDNSTKAAISASSTTETNTTVYLSDPIFGIVLALGFVATLISLGSCAFVYKYRNNRNVAIGQPPFLYLICFGCLLLSSQIYLLLVTTYSKNDGGDGGGGDDYNDGEGNSKNNENNNPYLDASCVAQLWLGNIGIVVIYMSIFCKLWRSFKVTRFQRNIRVLPKHVIGPFVIILTAVVCLTIAETILDPPYWDTLEFYYWNADNTTVIKEYGVCRRPTQVTDQEPNFSNTAPPTTTTAIGDLNIYDNAADISNTYGWINQLIQILQALSCLIVLLMACVVRKVPKEISDAHRVCQAMCANCCINSCFIIVFLIAIFFFHSLELMAITTGLTQTFQVFVFVGFLIFPKIHNVYWYGKQQSRTTAMVGRGNVRITGVVIGGNIADVVNTTASTTIAAIDDADPKTTVPGASTATNITHAQLWLAEVNDEDKDEDDEGIIISCEVSLCEQPEDAVMGGSDIPTKMQEEEYIDDGGKENASNIDIEQQT